METSRTWGGVALQPAGTLHGDLQRRLGRAARQAGRDPGAAAMVLDCVCDDPRWDGQVEGGAEYYAALIVELRVPLEAMRDHLAEVDRDPRDVYPDMQPGNDGGWRVSLCLTALGYVAARGDLAARRMLRDYIAVGASWMQALHALAIDESPPTFGDGLMDVVLGRVGDQELSRFVEDCEPWLSWARQSTRIQAVFDAEAAENDWYAAGAVGLARPVAPPVAPPAPDLTGLATAALASRFRRGYVLVDEAAELARRGELEVLCGLVEAQLTQQWPSGGVLRDLRSGLCRLPRETLQPRLLAWLALDRPERWTALRLLCDVAESADRPLLQRELESGMDRAEWDEVAVLLKAVMRLAGLTAALAERLWTLTGYSFVRQQVLRHLLTSDPQTGSRLAEEGLWDGDDVVRQLSAAKVPPREPFLGRLRVLAQDSLEVDVVREEAQRRLADLARSAGTAEA